MTSYLLIHESRIIDRCVAASYEDAIEMLCPKGHQAVMSEEDYRDVLNMNGLESMDY